LRKENAAGTYKSGFGFHPLGCWCANTGESLAMELRPGNAGSNTAADHISGLSAALAQIPAAFRRKVIVRLDGAGAGHDFIEHMTGLEIPGVTLLFTCGWTITQTAVILSFRVSRGCDLLRPVVDSVADRTLAA
jgi:hypothetical protein